MRRPSTADRLTVDAFTLIELLVVISIIALLIAILLPALQSAKRTTRVVLCSSNLKSYALGLTLYSNEASNGYYPSHGISGWGDTLNVWSSSSPVYKRDFPNKLASLSMFEDVICGGNWSIVWCPLDRNYYPDVGSDPKYPLIRYDKRFGENYNAGYMRYANLAIDGQVRGQRWLEDMWKESRNSLTNGPPLQPGNSDDAIISDMQLAAPLYLFSNHMDDVTAHSPADLTQQRENNVAYGDGHVETHGGQARFKNGWPYYPGAGYIKRGGINQKFIY